MTIEVLHGKGGTDEARCTHDHARDAVEMATVASVRAARIVQEFKGPLKRGALLESGMKEAEIMSSCRATNEKEIAQDALDKITEEG